MVKTSALCLMQAKSAGGGVTSLTSGHRPGLVSGSREGVITSWAVDSGITLQSIDISQVQPSELQKRLPAKGGWLACLSCLNNVSDTTIEMILYCTHMLIFMMVNTHERLTFKYTRRRWLLFGSLQEHKANCCPCNYRAGYLPGGHYLHLLRWHNQISSRALSVHMWLMQEIYATGCANC